MENSYNLSDIEIIDENQQADLYEDYESASADWDDSEVETERNFTVWHLAMGLVLLVIAALVLVYVVLPFIASLGAPTSASQILPNAVQA